MLRSTALLPYAGRKCPTRNKCSPIFVSRFGCRGYGQPLQKRFGDEITGVAVNFEGEGVTQRCTQHFLDPLCIGLPEARIVSIDEVTLSYLKLACPGIDQSTRTRLLDSILGLIDGEDRSLPRKKITDSHAVEMVWRPSQCVRNQTGKCPLFVFGKQLAEEINEFFKGDE